MGRWLFLDITHQNFVLCVGRLGQNAAVARGSHSFYNGRGSVALKYVVTAEVRPQNTVFTLGEYKFEVEEPVDYRKKNNNCLCHVHTACY